MRTLSESLKFAPKYVRIREDLRDKIQTGIYKPNLRVPTESRLMKQYRVSRITVTNAMKDLVNEGLLVRARSKGTFVAERKPVARPVKRAAFFLPHSGHIYGETLQRLVGKLQALGYHSSVYDPNSLPPLTELESLIRYDCEFLIVQGLATFPFALLDRFVPDPRRLIFLFHFETTLPFDGAGKVLIDYEHAGHIAMKHLLDLGHRRILFFSYRPEPEPYRCIHQALAGCRRAFEEQGVPFESAFQRLNWNLDGRAADVDDLVRVLSQPNRPTAVFCLADSHVREVYAAARRLGLAVPGDLAVMGFFNTPWCEIFNIPLTSVSIEEDQVARVAMDVIGGTPSVDGDLVWIKPRVVVRASCGATALAKAEVA